jgi:hypothetical protein
LRIGRGHPERVVLLAFHPHDGLAVQALVATASGRMTASAALSSIRPVKNPIGANHEGACS